MKMFEITNGYVGHSFVHVVCVAESEEKAVEAARKKFDAKAKAHNYTPKYREKLTVELLCADPSNGFCTEIYAWIGREVKWRSLTSISF